MDKSKERLIALLKQAQSHWDDYTDWGTGVTGTWEEFYADHLLKNNVIVSPCNIGDTVFCTGYGIVEELVADSISIAIHEDSPYDALVTAHRMNDTREVFYFEEFGNVVFTSREEAERKINESNTNSDN